MTPDADQDDINAAALQYVRKISGFRAPAAHNREVFDAAVAAVAAATADLLAGLEVRGPARPAHTHDHGSHAHAHAHADADGGAA
jgi:hypothetical protein